MKPTVVITLAAVTLAVTGCTTSDPTPPGSLGAIAEAEENDEEQGIPNEEELAEEEGEPAEGGDEAEQTQAPEGDEEPTEGEEGAEGENGGENAEGPSGEDLPDPAEMTDETCLAFFEGAAPLAGRAQDSLFLISEGSDNMLTEVEFSEIDVLAQRMEELGGLGTEEQSALIESINAPFLEVQSAAGEDGGQDGAVSYEPIDTEEAEQAQEQFTSACLSGS